MVSLFGFQIFGETYNLTKAVDDVLLLPYINLLDKRVLQAVDRGNEVHIPHQLHVDGTLWLHYIPVEVR